jgi:hypothetical protein
MTHHTRVLLADEVWRNVAGKLDNHPAPSRLSATLKPPAVDIIVAILNVSLSCVREWQ